MTTLCIVQARLSSKRLPRKVLMDIAGHPMLWHVVERAKSIRGVDGVVVACPLHDWADLQNAVNVPVMGWDGDEDDVLGRFLWVAEQTKADVLVRVTGDCPLFLPETAELCLWHFHGSGFGYVATEHDQSGWPDGTGCEAFRADELARLAGPAEHFTRLFGGGEWWPVILNPHVVPTGLGTFSVNTPDDLNYVRLVYSHLAPGDYSWDGLIRAERLTRTRVTRSPSCVL
jgi:spore coat polysaccharide biosynthesis protein SpsF (cytidylyltransferase family)